MEKRTINIMTIKGKKQIAGYLFHYNGLDLCVTNESTCFSYGMPWTITELKSGYYIGISGKTRKAAIDNLLKDPAIVNAIREKILLFKDNINDGIKPKTAIYGLTVYKRID